MRKIESLMNAAITAGKDWKSGNTAVVEADGLSVVLLHGNKIAEVGDTFITIFDGGWRTNTTKSRLNAIFNGCGLPSDGVFQKGGKWFVKSHGSTIPFSDGLTLR
jgi:hypothetical protein